MLYIGNCLDVMEGIPDDTVDLVVADPPYGNLIKRNEKGEKVDWDIISDYHQYSKRWLSQCRRILKPTGSIYCWCSIGPKSTSLLDIAQILREDWHFQDMVVWSKQRGRGNRAGWLFTREEILWATKSEKYVWNRSAQYSTAKYHESWIKRLHKEENPYKRATNVWSDIDEVSIEMVKKTGGKGNRKPIHPTQKPLGAIERIILAHTQLGDLVFDPFGGSGTTAEACVRHGRQWIMAELDQSYENVILERVANAQRQIQSALPDGSREVGEVSGAAPSL